VKSLGLVHPEQLYLSPGGVAGDRTFYLVDENGKLFDGSRLGPLVRIRASFDPQEDVLSLTFPNGEVAEGGAVADGEAVTTSFWGRPVTGREVPGPWSEPLSSFAGRPIRLMRPDRPGDASDSWPASLVSTGSLEELSRQAGGVVDARRFRMLIEIDGCEPHEEDAWIGRAVRVGRTVIRVQEPDSRCVVTTRDPETGIKDLDTLRLIAAYRGKRDGKKIDFGVYADVETPGTIRVGDAVEPL
jgi:hypothetical protein